MASSPTPHRHARDFARLHAAAIARAARPDAIVLLLDQTDATARAVAGALALPRQAGAIVVAVDDEKIAVLLGALEVGQAAQGLAEAPGPGEARVLVLTQGHCVAMYCPANAMA